MSDVAGTWPADPRDPRCPACDGPVSATATYCMHCGADLPTTDSPSTPTVRADTGAVRSGGSPSAERWDWLHPDGFVDNSLTVAVGVFAGAVVGALVATALVFALPGIWPFLAGAVAWAGATAHLFRSRTVLDALQSAGYLLALVLVALPLTISLTAPMAEPGTGDRLGFAVVLAVFAWPVALVLAGAGRFVAGRQSDRDGG